jgi:hypothetical protein
MAKHTIKYDDEDLSVALKEVIEEQAAAEIRAIVRERASELVAQVLDREIDPLVMSVLTGEKFSVRGYKDYLHSQDMAGLVKAAVVNYLDARVYHYDPSSDLPSKMVRDASDSHCGPTRLEVFLRYCIDKHIDAHIKDKMGAVTKEFIEKRGDIEKAAREQMASLLKEKFRL